MPHISVKMYKGRTEEQKQKLAKALSDAMLDAIGCDETHISITINDYDKAEWGEKVFYPEIMADESALYKKPEYKPE